MILKGAAVVRAVRRRSPLRRRLVTGSFVGFTRRRIRGSAPRRLSARDTLSGQGPGKRRSEHGDSEGPEPPDEKPEDPEIEPFDPLQPGRAPELPEIEPID